MKSVRVMSPHDLLLVLWVALLGADRVNLLNGVTPFVMTPFLALTPIVVMSELVRHVSRGTPFTITPPALTYTSLCFALIAVVGASVLVSTVPGTSVARAALLVAQVAGTFVVAIALSGRENVRAVLAGGAAMGLLFFAVFDAAEFFATLKGVSTIHAGPLAVALMTFSYGSLIPRLGGTVADPNRAGLVLMLYGFVVVTCERRAVLRRLLIAAAIPMLLVTLSRSGILAVAAAGVMLWIDTQPRRVSRTALFAGSMALVGVAVWLTFYPQMLERASNFVTPTIAQRTSLSEGSAQEHLAILQRGLAEATETPARVALGIGYGSAYTVLQDFFPGNKYGNFHSLYVTILAECGVVALLITLVLLGFPLLQQSTFRPLVFGVIVFNLFQNANAEPAFWFILALAWFGGSLRDEGAAPD